MVKFVNRTPHAVVMIGASSRYGDLTFAPSGIVARAISAPQEPLGLVAADEDEGIEGIPLVSPPAFSDVVGIDTEPEEHVIVSALAAPIAATKRKHVYSPDSGPESAVRNERGEIIGVRRLIRWS